MRKLRHYWIIYLTIGVPIIKCTSCNIGVRPLTTSSTRPWCKCILGEFWEGITRTLNVCSFFILGLRPMQGAVQRAIEFLHWATGLGCGRRVGHTHIPWISYLRVGKIYTITDVSFLVMLLILWTLQQKCDFFLYVIHKTLKVWSVFLTEYSAVE